MHNWPEAECSKILKQARGVAGKETKLVIVEIVLAKAFREGPIGGGYEGIEGGGKMNGDKGERVPPEPLLVNWGAANGLGYKLDLCVSHLRLLIHLMLT